MRASLKAQVLAGSLLVAVVASVLAATLTWTHLRNAQAEGERTRTAAALVVQQVALEYIMGVGTSSNDWSGLDTAVSDAAESIDARVVVIDRNSGVELADSEPSPTVENDLSVDAVINPAFGLVARVDNNGAISDDATASCSDQCFDHIAGFSPPVSLFVDVETPAGGTGFDLVGTLLALAGVAAASVLLAWWVSRRITRPVDALSASADRLGHGDLDQRVATNHGAPEVTVLAHSFNAMAANLQRSEAARTTMIADVAHELRNPIGTIIGNIEAAQDGIFDIDTALIDRLHAEANHLSRLIEDVQHLALADVGGIQIETALVDVGILVSETIAAYTSSAAEHNVSLHAFVDGAIVADIDATRIQQVLHNLVKNAIAYTPAGGTVTIEAGCIDEHIEFHVNDTGVGLTPTEQQHVFDRFWRADHSRSRTTGGSGIGLSVCTALVSAHGGTIEVSSEPGRGSRFTVKLPDPNCTPPDRHCR